MPSATYFEALQAPCKELVWFDDSARMPTTEDRNKFNAFMIDEARLPIDA